MRANLQSAIFYRLIFLILILILGISNSELYAQKSKLTLNDAIELVRQNQSLKKQYDYAREAVQHQIRFYKSDQLPNLQFRTFVSHANEAPRIPVEFKNDTVLARQGTQDTFISRFELNQMIYDFGKTKNQIKSIRYEDESIGTEYQQKEFELLNQVHSQFYLSLYYQKLDSIYLHLIPFARELVQINRQRLKNGAGFSTDILNAQVELQGIESKRIRARREYQKTLIQLANLTGQDYLSFETYGHLPQIPEEENVATQYNRLYQLALRHRRDLQQLDYKSMQQEYLARSFESLKYPTLMLQSDFSYFGPDAFGYYSGLSSRGLEPFNWRVGIGFTYTLFDGSRIRSQKNQAIALKQQYREQGARLEENMGTEIQLLLNDINILREFERNNRLLVRQVNANIEVSEAAFNNGKISRLEYIQSITAKISAEEALQKTRSDIAQLLVQLQSTVGTDIMNFWKIKSTGIEK